MEVMYTGPPCYILPILTPYRSPTSPTDEGGYTLFATHMTLDSIVFTIYTTSAITLHFRSPLPYPSTRVYFIRVCHKLDKTNFGHVCDGNIQMSN